MAMPPNGHSTPVLIVESDPASLDFLARSLEQAGIANQAVRENGQSFTHLLERSTRIGVVIIEAAAIPRVDQADRERLSRREDLQWIIVGARPALDGAVRHFPTDSTDFLVKPVSRGVLIRATQEAMRRHHAFAERRQEQRLLQEVAMRLPQPEAAKASKEEVHAELRVLQALADIDDTRIQAFPSIIEPDPTWNMLMELLRAKVLGQRISVTSLCLSSRTPVTTALRRLERLVELELVQHGLDAKDRRRKYIELSPQGHRQMHAVLHRFSREICLLNASAPDNLASPPPPHQAAP